MEMDIPAYSTESIHQKILSSKWYRLKFFLQEKFCPNAFARIISPEIFLTQNELFQITGRNFKNNFRTYK